MGTEYTGISRRDFMKGTAIGALGIVGVSSLAVTSLGMTGCSSSNAQKTKMTPGTYKSKGAGRHGDIVVSVEVNETQILGIDIVSHSETPTLSDNALKILPRKIVATQNVEVDAVSGATLTSMGILAAVQDALQQAGGSAASLAPNTAGLDVEQHMKPGKYTAEANGCWAPKSVEGGRFGSKGTENPQLIKVEVTVDESSIKSVSIVTCTDVDWFKQPVIDRIPSAIVEQQSLFVDAVTGATRTTAGVLSATAQALEQAGANLVGFSKTKERSTETEEYDCDICIVGGGCSGTLAALSAAEEGAKIIVLEKSGRIGGRGFCSSGISAAGAKIELDAGVTKTTDQLYQSLYRQSGGRANALLVKKIVEESGKTVDYLASHGFKITPPNAKETLDDAAYVCSTAKGQDKFDVLYKDYILKTGSKVILETAAKQLIVEKGKITGIRAKQQSGKMVTIKCKSAILATGGFGGSSTMMKRFFQSDDFYDRGLTTNCSGDSIAMCEAIGAKLGAEIMPHMQEYGANKTVDFTANLIKYITYAGFMQVNPQGQRFMDEGLCITDPMGYGCASLRVHGYYYVIISQEQVDALTAKGIDGFYDKKFSSYVGRAVARAIEPLTTLKDDLNNAISAGQAWKGGSAEEIAKAVGFANPSVFVSSFNQYNQICKQGVDKDFGKIAKLLKEYTFPCYAVRMAIPLMGTLGGVQVNEKLEVVDKQQNTVLGLYVCGQEGSGFYSYPYYTTKCSTSTYAYTSGRLAGINAINYIKASK